MKLALSPVFIPAQMRAEAIPAARIARDDGTKQQAVATFVAMRAATTAVAIDNHSVLERLR